MASQVIVRWWTILFGSVLVAVAKRSAAAPVDNGFQPGVVASKVIHLRRDNFKQAVEDPANPVWLLKFYAPWYVWKSYLYSLSKS